MRTVFKVAAITLAVAVIAGSVGFAHTPAPSVPGGSISVTGATLTDRRTGNEYLFDLVAEEDDVEGGFGRVTTLWVRGPSLSLCSAHGSPAGDAGFPLLDIECGFAEWQAVAINGCVAEIELHGYSHSDYPFVTYMGMMTLDLRLVIGEGPGDGRVQVTVHTPKEKIKLGGMLDGATIDMPTCP